MTPSRTTKTTAFIFGTITPPIRNTPGSTYSMFCGVVVQTMSTRATITEIRPIETIRPLIRLLRVKRKSAWSTTQAEEGDRGDGERHRERVRQCRPSVRYQVK